MFIMGGEKTHIKIKFWCYRFSSMFLTSQLNYITLGVWITSHGKSEAYQRTDCHIDNPAAS